MARFQKTTLIIFGVMLLLFTLTLIFLISRNKNNIQYPPEVSNCPDYWTTTGEYTCENTMNLGTCGKTADFSDAKYQGASGNKAKCEWAKSCGVYWDGISQLC